MTPRGPSLRVLRSAVKAPCTSRPPLLAMQLSGEPTPALRGKDATVDRAASPGTRCGNRCLPVPKRAGQCRGPGSAPDCSLEGASTGTKLGRRSTSTSPPRPFTPRLGRRSPSRRTRRWCACQTAARRLLQAAFNGFLAIKSMRLFALRTVSIGKPARAWTSRCGRAGRPPLVKRADAPAAGRARAPMIGLAAGLRRGRRAQDHRLSSPEERPIGGCEAGRSVAMCPSGRNAPMTRKRTIGAMRDQTPFVF